MTADRCSPTRTDGGQSVLAARSATRDWTATVAHAIRSFALVVIVALLVLVVWLVVAPSETTYGPCGRDHVCKNSR